jgi:ABC-2 type transport system permease protein
MSIRLTLVTARRVLNQLRGDHRTIGLMLVVPMVLMTILAWMFSGDGTFDRIGAPLLGVFPFIVMFLVTSVAMLRERTGGTLERLLSTPISKLDLLLGYAFAFGAVAFVQAGLTTALALWGLDLDVRGHAWLLIVVALANAWLGTTLGLLVSAFAASEFQAVQFLPAVILPQFLLCGLLVPRHLLPDTLEALSDVLPLSYAVDALTRVATESQPAPEVTYDILVIALFATAALAVGASTLRRRTE